MNRVLACMKQVLKNTLPPSVKGKIKRVLQEIVTTHPAVGELQTKTHDLSVAMQQLNEILGLERSLPRLPPKHLQVRVVGGYVGAFVSSGYRALRDLNRVLAPTGKALSEFPRILDFGCGCGRVLRALRNQLPKQELHGTDIDAEAIGWLQQHCEGIAQFTVNPPLPPMPYADDTFDFIYSISIFTHLPEPMQHSWLADLRRVVKPGGHLVVTIHGANHHSQLEPAQQAAVKSKGFCYASNEHATTAGLPSFYQNAWHDHAYIQREWTKYFDVVAMVARGLENHQDAILLRKAPVPVCSTQLHNGGKTR